MKQQELKVVSLFSGAGGFDIGLEQAGFKTVVCVEIDEHCRETLKTNRPEWGVIDTPSKEGKEVGDIREISVQEILKKGKLKKGEAALVIGGAPCQPFSNIGKKEGKECPKNGDLFQEFVRVVKGVSPRALIFENVTGITQKKHALVLEYMRKQLEVLGYQVDAKILTAADYGVPQKRERFILIGVKGEKKPSFPIKTHFKTKEEYEKYKKEVAEEVVKYRPWKTVGEAFKEIPKEKIEKRTDYAVMNISEVVRKRMELIGPNENFKVLPDEMLPNCWKSGKHQGADTFGRIDKNGVSNTIRTAAYNPSKGKYIHPTENRGLNTIEMAVLQSFPLNWEFKMKGKEKITLKSGGMQIGNAVPPLMAKALGEEIKKLL